MLPNYGLAEGEDDFVSKNSLIWCVYNFRLTMALKIGYAHLLFFLLLLISDFFIFPILPLVIIVFVVQSNF